MKRCNKTLYSHSDKNSTDGRECNSRNDLSLVEIYKSSEVSLILC